MHRIHTAAIAIRLIASRAHADDSAPYDLPIINELDRIVLTATLDAREQRNVASEVGVTEADKIERQQVQGLADLVRYDPGISATGSAIGGGRFGTAGLSIRGLGGNGVRIEQDGIAIPDAFEIVVQRANIDLYSASGRAIRVGLRATF